MNDPFVAAQAALWAEKVLADPAATPAQRIERMYRDAFTRPPTAAERQAALKFLAGQSATHGQSFEAQPRFEPAWADLAHALMNTKEFIFVP
jgi:hypothetical protein